MYAALQVLLSLPIFEGNLDPHNLAEHRNGNCRKSYDEIAKALKGNNRKDYLFELKQKYDSYLFFGKKIDDCDKQINSFLKSQINTDPVKRKLRTDDKSHKVAKQKCIKRN